jgi:hypothetical protein
MSVRTNGSSTYLTSPASSVYNSLDQSTICMWIKPISLSSGVQSIIVKDPNNAYSPQSYITDSNKSFGGIVDADAFGNNGEADSIANTVTVGVWIHYAFSYNLVGGGPMKLYKNGVEVSYVLQHTFPPGSTPVDDSGDGWWIGFDNSTFFYDGEISDMRIYNVALSAAQIASVAAGGTPASANLVAQWKFCAGNLLADSSGNGNTLTNFGAVAGASQPPVDACAATTINLLSNSTVAVAAGSTIVNTGNTVLNGDLVLSPGSVVSGFPPGIVTGTQHIDDPFSVQSQLDLVTAYNQAAGETPAATIATELGGAVLSPGIYTSAAGTFAITSVDLTLDAGGNANAVWIFQMATTLITGNGRSILLANGAQAKNVFFQVGSSATLGTNNTFNGTILALTSITTGLGTLVNGHLLARNGSVTMNGTTVTPSVPASTFTISGTISGVGGAGATVNLTGTATATTTADGGGNYSFTGLANGVYTVTPTNAGYTFSPASRLVTISGANFSGGSFIATPVPPPPTPYYSVPDCRVAPFGPNASRDVNNTLIYDVQTSDNAAVPSKDSRATGVPVDSRVSPNIPSNSRTPGTFGPGE